MARVRNLLTLCDPKRCDACQDHRGRESSDPESNSTPCLLLGSWSCSMLRHVGSLQFCAFSTDQPSKIRDQLSQLVAFIDRSENMLSFRSAQLAVDQGGDFFGADFL